MPKRSPDRNAAVGSTAAFRIALVYAGCAIGAGFLSGQELCQFFGAHGKWGFLGLAVAVLAFAVLGGIILSLAVDSGEERMDSIVVFFDAPLLRGAVAVFEIVFLFMVYLLSAAAFGSLFLQLFSLHTVWGSAVFCLLTTVLSLRGIKGLVRFLSLVVPLLMIATVVFALITVLTSEGLHFPTRASEGFLSGFWGFDGLTYAVFNLFCALPVLAPLGRTVRDGRTARRGILLGALFLGVLILLILLAVATRPECALLSLPMLELAMGKHAVFGYLYAFLLMLAIFSAGISSESAMNEYFLQRFPRLGKGLIPVAFGISLTALFLGLFSFRDLVGLIYPLLGYIGFAPLALLLIHAVIFYRRKTRRQKENRESL